MFKYIENTDPMKAKQLEKGIQQLMDEGVAQLFVNQFNGRKIIGTVGQLQFEVIQYRLLHEYGATVRWEPLSLYKACWIESDDEEALAAFKKRKHQFMAVDRDGRDVFLADSNYVLQMAQSDFPKIKFHSLQASFNCGLQGRHRLILPVDKLENVVGRIDYMIGVILFQLCHRTESPGHAY